MRGGVLYYFWTGKGSHVARGLFPGKYRKPPGIGGAVSGTDSGDGQPGDHGKQAAEAV